MKYYNICEIWYNPKKKLNIVVFVIFVLKIICVIFYFIGKYIGKKNKRFFSDFYYF
jgi:hypothetical protein